MEEDRFMTLHGLTSPQMYKLVKKYLSGMQWSGCLGGLDLLIACL